MCHLRRKAEALRDIDSKAGKPILIALSKLHRHVEPRLGDLWLWRHDETTKLRGLLGSLHKKVPVKAIGAILDEVDQDLVHIRKHMVNHPARQGAGGNAFASSVEADQSSSVRLMRDRRLEEERRERDRKARNGGCKARDRGSKSEDAEKRLSLPESDIHPPCVKVKKSVRLVETWMRRNDALVAVYSKKDLKNRSMVSVVGRGISQRPAIDVGIWEIGAGEKWKERSCGSSVVESQHCVLPNTTLSNCVYEAPSGNLQLDMRIFGQLADVAEKTGTKHQFQRSLSSALQRKRVEKLSRRCRISITAAVRLLQAKEKRKERHDLMSGGRSIGPSPKTSIETVANSSIEEMSLESSKSDSISLTASEMGGCIERAGTETKMSLRSSNTATSLFSSRPSPLNVGSLVQLSRSDKENGSGKIPGRHALSETSLGSNKEQPATSSHKPTMPVPIGRPPSTNTANKGEHQQKSSESRASIANTREAQVKNEEKRNDDLPTKSPYVKYAQSRKYETSEAAQNASQRRTERRDSLLDEGNPGNGTTPDRTKSRIFAGSLDPEPNRVRAVAVREQNPRNIATKEDIPTVQVDLQRRARPKPGIAQSGMPKVSEAVKNSRRRRGEKESTPFQDRYRNEERKKAWSSMKD